MSALRNRKATSIGDRYETARSKPGRSITRAVLSPDGMYIAAITSQSEILISRCASEQSSVIHHIAKITSKQAQKVLAHAEILRWSPEVYTISGQGADPTVEAGVTDYIRAWLLVSDRQHLTVLCVELDLLGGTEAACTIIADFDLGTALGKFSFADFCFSHEYAIVLQATGIQPSIISLTRPERHDIGNTKYSDNQGVAVSQNSKYFAIITRNEGQDVIQVFTTTELDSIKSSAFSPLTHDAQGLRWCPTGDPLLCVWDSASFGFKVSFFTANGHHLRQLDLSPGSPGLGSIPADFQGLGVHSVNWISCNGKASLGIFDSSGKLFLWGQSESQKIHSPIGTMNHQHIIDGTVYPVWQESQDGKPVFTRHSAAFEPQNVPKPAGGDQVGINADGQLLATRESSRPWTLWLWDVSWTQPLAVINFRERIKQLLWHPKDPELLLILTVQKQPLLYVWHAKKQQVSVSEHVAMSDDAEASNSEGRWLEGGVDGAPLLLVSSPHSYDIGFMDLNHEEVVFQSLLQEDSLDGI